MNHRAIYSILALAQNKITEKIRRKTGASTKEAVLAPRGAEKKEAIMIGSMADRSIHPSIQLVSRLGAFSK